MGADEVIASSVKDLDQRWNINNGYVTALNSQLSLAFMRCDDGNQVTIVAEGDVVIVLVGNDRT